MDDEAIGQNIARLRGPLSQVDLAKKMKGKGWKWSQSTVWSVEKGDRPLRLREASDLAEILGTPLESLLVPPQQLNTLRELAKNTTALDMEYDATVEAVRGLIGQAEVVRALLDLDIVRADSSELGVKHRSGAQEILTQRTLRSAVLQGFWENEVNNHGEQKAAEMLESHGSMWDYLVAVTGFDGGQ